MASHACRYSQTATYNPYTNQSRRGCRRPPPPPPSPESEDLGLQQLGSQNLWQLRYRSTALSEACGSVEDSSMEDISTIYEASSSETLAASPSDTPVMNEITSRKLSLDSIDSTFRKHYYQNTQQTHSRSYSESPWTNPRSCSSPTPVLSTSRSSRTSSTSSSTTPSLPFPTLGQPFEPSFTNTRSQPLPKAMTRCGVLSCRTRGLSRSTPSTPPLSPTYISPHASFINHIPSNSSPLRIGSLTESLTPSTDPPTNEELESEPRLASRFSDYGSEDGDLRARFRSFSLTAPLRPRGQSSSLPTRGPKKKGLRKSVESVFGCVMGRN